MERFSPPAEQRRILIADAHDIMREGVRALIEQKIGWEVCGVARTGPEAVDLASTLKPEIALLDIDLPELSGLDTAVEIIRRVQGVEILMFGADLSDDLISEVFEAGVKSLLEKDEAHTFLASALDSLSRHKPYFTERVSEVLFSNITNRNGAEQVPRLTARELEIVQLLAKGKRNKEVADALGVSVRTVEAHRASILHKLNLDSVAGLVLYAIRNKIIEP